MKKKHDIKLRNVMLIGFFLIICSSLFCYIVYKDTDRIKITEISQCSYNERLQWHIDEISTEDSIRIKGWALIQGVEIRTAEIKVLLKKETNDKYIEIPTQIDGRPDLTMLREKENTNYLYSGFIGRVSLKQIDLKDESYEVFINYRSNNSNYLIRTGQVIGNKE